MAIVDRGARGVQARLYTDDDVGSLLVIRRMKPLDYSLGEMLTVMSAIEGAEDAHPLARPIGRA